MAVLAQADETRTAPTPAPEPDPAEQDMRAADKHEPPFPNCWADDDMERCTVEMGGVVFRMRTITVGEAARIARETKRDLQLMQASPAQLEAFAGMKGKTPKDMTDEDRQELDRLLAAAAPGKDGIQEVILTVAAALGAWNTYGDEGWTSPRPVTVASVAALKDEVVGQLYLAYATFSDTRAARLTQSAKGN